jgi:hypothetical protein
MPQPHMRVGARMQHQLLMHMRNLLPQVASAAATRHEMAHWARLSVISIFRHQ